jgi:hypothetical protein
MVVWAEKCFFCAMTMVGSVALAQTATRYDYPPSIS